MPFSFNVGFTYAIKGVWHGVNLAYSGNIVARGAEDGAAGQSVSVPAVSAKADRHRSGTVAGEILA
jgi:hypothetical protein